MFHPNAWSLNPLPTTNECQVRAAGPRGRLGPVWPGLYGWPAGEALQVLPEERALEETQMGGMGLGMGGWGWGEARSLTSKCLGELSEAS